jgi:ribokinase
MQNILVIGSSNTDMVIKTERFPIPGETIIGGEFFMFPGGKGANQAVAASRLGGRVTLLCKIGMDVFGSQAVDGFLKENINVDHVITDQQHASGVALIMVNQQGENKIVVASGANAALLEKDIEKVLPAILDKADIVLLQLEIPVSTTEFIVQKAFEHGKRVILNPAPAQLLSSELFSHLFLITPNETEAALLSGIEVRDEKTAWKAAAILLERGVQNVIITLGASGALFKNADEQFLLKPPRVTAVDSTAAGDVFNGALAVAIAEGRNWKTAIEFANCAAAISVTRMGAQSSTPFRSEIE